MYIFIYICIFKIFSPSNRFLLFPFQTPTSVTPARAPTPTPAGI